MIAVTLASRTERVPNGDFDYAAAVEEILGPLSEFTGIELPQGPPRGRQLRVADRAEWIDFNIEGFGALMEPVLKRTAAGDRKSTRLNSSHANISYAVFCLKKKK